MKTVALFFHLNQETDLEFAKKVCRTIATMGGRAVMRKEREASALLPEAELLEDAEFFAQSDVALSLGGDGTLLWVAKQTAPYGIPVLGINLGHLGFLSELERADFDLLSQLFRGEYNIESRMRIDVTAKDHTGGMISLTALNDAVISRGLSSKMLQIEVTAAGHYLNRYNADGIIVATPTGSTAYSLSAGGPVIEPGTEVLSVVPICPHALSARPLILSGEKRLELCAESPLSQDVLLSVDGQSVSLPSGSEIFIEKSPHATQLIRMKSRNFYDVLRKKLS